ncbi:MAG TPA: RNA methyltransferase [Chthonomonadaceae bacterium]|nr:RNA methyltransferase [Chthonomonadaceae bacterium]
MAARKIVKSEDKRRPPPHAALITSLNNPAVKRIRRLRLRPERERTGLFFVEGIRFVLAALEHGAEIETWVVCPQQWDAVANQHPRISCLRSAPEILRVAPEVLQWMAGREDTQGIGAVVRQRWEKLPAVRPARELGWVALDGIQYPGNLGTILRACDAVGCAGVILLGNTADPFDPLAVRASMGAVFYQRLVRSDFEEFLAWKRRYNLPVIGTSPGAAVAYRQTALPVPNVIYMGSEGRGLSQERQAACDIVVRIPMAGHCDSLNVALAAGVLLYEIYHQAKRS